MHTDMFVCVSNWMSSLSTSLLPVSYSCCLFFLPIRSSLPPKPYLSLLLCFHRLSLLSLSLSHLLFFIFSSVLVLFIIHFFSLSFLISLVYLCLIQSLPVLCGLICFCSFVFFPCFLSSYFHIVSCLFFALFLSPPQFLPLVLLLLIVVSLMLLIVFTGLPSLSAFFLSSNFYALFLFSFLDSPPFIFFYISCFLPFLHPSIFLILPPSIALCGNLFLICHFLVPHPPSCLPLPNSFISKSDSPFSPSSLYTPAPPFPVFTIYLSFLLLTLPYLSFSLMLGCHFLPLLPPSSFSINPVCIGLTSPGFLSFSKVS